MKTHSPAAAPSCAAAPTGLRLVEPWPGAAPAGLDALLERLTAHRLTVCTSRQRLHVTPVPPAEVAALLALHSRTLYRVLTRWGDSFGMALLHAAHDLPPVPFVLRPGVTVVDAGRFRAALLQGALAGPRGARARGVEADVRALLWRGTPSGGEDSHAA